MKRMLKTVLSFLLAVSLLLTAGAGAIAEEVFVLERPEDADVYELGASTLMRDWMIQENLAFSVLTNGPLIGLTGGRTGIFVFVESGIVAATSEKESTVIWTENTSSDALVDFIVSCAGSGSTKIDFYDVDKPIYSTPGVSGGDTVPGVYTALGACIAAASQAGVSLPPPVYAVRDGEFIELSLEGVIGYLTYYANAGGSHMTEWHHDLLVSGNTESPDAAKTVRLLKAQNNMRLLMIDYAIYSHEELSFPEGAYIQRDPNDLAVIISARDQVYVFWFLHDTDTESLVGYIASNFMLISCLPEEYTLYLIELDEDHNVENLQKLSAEEKESAMSAYLDYQLSGE